MKSNDTTSASKGRKNDRLITLFVVITGALITAALLRFNDVSRGYEYYIVGNAMALFFVPMLMIMLVFGAEPASFGFCLGDSKKVRWWVLAIFAGLLIAFIPSARNHNFQDYYPIFKSNQFIPFRGNMFSDKNLWDLIYGWASYGMYMFFWEFFFRGYLLFGMSRTIKWPAVIIQAIPFMILHWGKVPIEFIMSFPAGIALGFLALKAKSFVPGFVLHWAAAVSFDILVLMHAHKLPLHF